LDTRKGIRVWLLGVAPAVALVCGQPALAGAHEIQVVTTTSDHPPDGCDASDCTLREAITKGKHSAATVVGTEWLVEDRCASTTTRVTQGRVSVRDFVKKTVIVRVGKKARR
jgi:CSLREA domain-containing protein